MCPQWIFIREQVKHSLWLTVRLRVTKPELKQKGRFSLWEESSSVPEASDSCVRATWLPVSLFLTCSDTATWAGRGRFVDGSSYESTVSSTCIQLWRASSDCQFTSSLLQRSHTSRDCDRCVCMWELRPASRSVSRPWKTKNTRST